MPTYRVNVLVDYRKIGGFTFGTYVGARELLKRASIVFFLS